MSKYQGSNMSNDKREATEITIQKSVPPTFQSRDEFNGFQAMVSNAWKAGIIPESIKSVEQAIVIALKGRELGLEPLYALSVIYMVHGRPGLEGEVMLALVLRKYPLAHVRWVETSHKQAVLELGRPGGPVSTFSFSLADAKRAGLITKINDDGTVQASAGKSVWGQYTNKMLAWRAVSQGVTLLFPECVMGCLTPDELVSPDPVQAVIASDLDAEFTEAAPEKKPEIAATAESIEAEVIAEKEVVIKTPIPRAEKEFVPLPFEPVVEVAMQKNPDYALPAGQYFGKKLKDLTKAQLQDYCVQLKRRDDSVKGSDPQVKDMLREITAYLR